MTDYPGLKQSSEKEGHIKNDMPAGTRDIKQKSEQEGHTSNVQPSGGRNITTSGDKA